LISRDWIDVLQTTSVVEMSFAEKIVLTSWIDHDYGLVDGPVYGTGGGHCHLEEIVLQSHVPESQPG
jgi:hypothetical protein